MLDALVSMLLVAASLLAVVAAIGQVVVAINNIGAPWAITTVLMIKWRTRGHTFIDGDHHFNMDCTMTRKGEYLYVWNNYYSEGRQYSKPVMFYAHGNGNIYVDWDHDMPPVRAKWAVLWAMKRAHLYGHLPDPMFGTRYTFTYQTDDRYLAFYALVKGDRDVPEDEVSPEESE